MIQKIIHFLAVCAAGLITGGQYVVSFDYRGSGVPASFYTEKMQYAIHHIGTPLFAMLIAATVLSFGAAIVNRLDKRTAFLLVGAGACFLIGGLITAFGNIPLLDMIDTWNVSSPPADWQSVADRWYMFHSVRFGIDVIGLLLSVLSARPQTKDFSPTPPDDAYLTNLSDKYLQRYKEHIGRCSNLCQKNGGCRSW